MWTFNVLLLITGASVAVHGKFITKNILLQPDERIVGGTKAPDGAVPYMVSLRYSGRHRGGGSIISKRWVLSAASCTELLPAIDSVVVGSNRLDQGGAEYKIDHCVTYDDFNLETWENDISLIKLTSDIKFGPAVKAIALPKSDTAVGARVLLSGWGYTENDGVMPNDLQWINLTAISVSDCRERHNLSGIPFPVYDTQICTLTKTGEGACGDDNGGPLVENGVLVGVLSWGGPLCADGYPDVYSRVWSFRDWISNEIEKK